MQMKKLVFMLGACALFAAGDVCASENNTKDVESASVTETTASARLVQTCGGSANVSLSSDGYTLYVNFGSSSFRIDWYGTSSGSNQYCPPGTTSVTVLADRFTISVPGESGGSSVQTYCFKIER